MNGIKSQLVVSSEIIDGALITIVESLWHSGKVTLSKQTTPPGKFDIALGISRPSMTTVEDITPASRLLFSRDTYGKAGYTRPNAPLFGIRLYRDLFRTSDENAGLEGDHDTSK